MAGPDVNESQKRPSSLPRHDEINTLVTLLTVAGMAISVQQLLTPYVDGVVAIVIAVSVTTLFMLGGLAAIRLIRRWRDRISLRLWVVAVYVATAAVAGLLTGLVLSRLFNSVTG